MIISFRHKGLRLFHETGNARGIQAAHVQRLRRQLQFLDSAVVAEDMSVLAGSCTRSKESGSVSGR